MGSLHSFFGSRLEHMVISRCAILGALALFFVCGTVSVAQPPELPLWGCHVRYDYDGAGNRTDRYWHCWNQTDPEGMAVLGNNALRLGPVPAETELRLSLDSAVTTGRLEVLDAKGEVLSEQQWTGSSMTVAVAQLASGSYFVRLRMGDEYFIRSFVIAH